MTWTNKDFGIHTITEDQDLFNSKDLRPAYTFDHRFDRFDSASTFYYHCKIYPSMTGKIMVK